MIGTIIDTVGIKIFQEVKNLMKREKER